VTSSGPGGGNGGGKGKRLKWEPAALMALVLGLGLWVAFGPAGKPTFDLRPGATTEELRVANTRGVLEAAPDPASGEYTFRVLLRDQPPGAVLTRAEAERAFGGEVVSRAIAPASNWVFRTLNITSWVNVVWIGIGLAGQLAFSGRMVLQWIVSEKRRQSVITESFWWFSLFGAVTLFSYFVWRQDPIGILGQASGIVIYVRNIRLIYKQKRRAAREEARGGGESSTPASGTPGSPRADVEPPAPIS
jgi:lipid-A-disaccharide synthase-like uncharacterized protein